MRPALLAAALSLLLPASALAAGPASFTAGRSIITASSSPGNAYLAGASVVVASPTGGDLSAFGGSLVVTAPITGDALFLGGSVDARAKVNGDVRALGGNVTIERPVGGDLSIAAFSVRDEGRAGGSVFVVAANTTLAAGAAGPVRIYGNDVFLSGDFGSDVNIVASGRVTVAASTTIRGALTYESPEEANISTAATIKGGVHYTNTSYLPSSAVSRQLAVVSLGIFLLMRILGALILAGLLAGLFPRLGEAVMAQAYLPVRSIFLTLLLGFAVLVATPVLLVLIALTFVGIGIALLLFICYALLTFLAYLYAGVLVGNALARRFGARESVVWRDGVLGMFAVSVIGLIPIVGPLLVGLLTMFCAGTLLMLFFHFAFPKSTKGDLV